MRFKRMGVARVDGRPMTVACGVAPDLAAVITMRACCIHSEDPAAAAKVPPPTDLAINCWAGPRFPAFAAAFRAHQAAAADCSPEAWTQDVPIVQAACLDVIVTIAAVFARYGCQARTYAKWICARALTKADPRATEVPHAYPALILRVACACLAGGPLAAAQPWAEWLPEATP
jgi:hypothetical protein